jgi:hypothetical protein
MFCFVLLYPACEESPQLGASRLYNLMFTKKHRSKAGMSNAHKTQNQSTNTHTSHNSSSQHNPKSSLRIECAELESWCLGMLRECLVYSSMHLGVPFISPRQLGAVESIPGRQFLPSVAWHTGQSGAPPDTVRRGFLSYFGAADRWRFRAVGAPDTVRCTPDSPVPPSDRWLCHASRADYAADRWPGRLLAHRTVRCTTGQSGDL